MKKKILLCALFCCFLHFSYSQPGTLDTSFGTKGIVTADLGAPYDYGFSAKKVLWQTDGSTYLIIQIRAQVIIAKRLPDGSADPTFGLDGFSSPVTINANDAALRQDGKIVIAGRTIGSDTYDYEILRYNKGGSLDSSFSGDGKITTDFSQSARYKYSEATSVAIQSDGKVVAAGIETSQANPGELRALAYSIARYNNDGSLDKTFSGDGKEYNESFSGANTVAIQNDGKIVVAGGDGDGAGIAAFGIARYKTDGSPDSTFSEDGIETTGYEAKSAAIQNDGKILIAGRDGNYFFTLARYNKDGSPDSTFDNDGVQTNNLIGEANSVVVTNDGKIVASGIAGIARFNTDGTLDNTFSEDGIITLTIRTVKSIALQDDEKIIAAGSAFARYDTDGSLDNAFNPDGKLPLNTHPGLTVFSKSKIQKDGKIVAAGNTWNGSNFCFVIARFNPEGSVDSSFNADGKQTTSLSSGEHEINAIAIQSDGKIVVTGYFYDTCGVNTCTRYCILRYNANGSLDNSFGMNGIQFADFQIKSATVQADDKILVAGSFGGDFTVARYMANGSLDSTFSEDGKQTTVFYDDDQGGERVSSYANSIAIQSDGKIVASGIIYGFFYHFVVVRYSIDGSPDGSAFGSTGGSYSANDNGEVIIQKDGKIVVAGSTYYRGSTSFVIMRFNTDGSRDKSFSEDGFVDLFIGLYDYASSAAIESDGKILVAGSAIIRLNEDGSLDAAFGNKGIVKTDDSEANEFVNDIAVSDDKLYATGYGSLSGTVGVIARFLLDESSDKPPTVSITTPANNATYLAPAAQIKLSAAASDSDGTIAKVEFYNGNTLLHTETVAPYGFVWRNVPLGNYTLTAKATDNRGLVTTSAAVHISVVPNKPPTVSIVAPANNEHYAAPAYIHFEAAASDTDGRITRVEFYNGSTLIRTEYQYPYTYVWKNVPAGTYTITAVATDNWGAQTTSVPIVVKVKSANRTIVTNKALINNKNSLSTAESLMLYPNPVNQTLNIYTKGIQPNKSATISIISVSGAVWKTMQSKSLNQTAQLDVSALMKGVYIIKVISGGKVMYKQFVKL